MTVVQNFKFLQFHACRDNFFFFELSFIFRFHLVIRDYSILINSRSMIRRLECLHYHYNLQGLRDGRYVPHVRVIRSTACKQVRGTDLPGDRDPRARDKRD